MASPSEAATVALERSLESALAWRGDTAEWPLLAASAELCSAEGLAWLDRRLVGLCRERGPLKVVLARLAARLVSTRAWERIGYARLGDYAVEQLGLSGRSVRDLAEVGARLGARRRLEHALASGSLGWTKVRLLARLPLDEGEDEVAWIAYASRVTAEVLAQAVRAVDRSSVEAGGAEEPGARSRRFEVRCTPEVRWKWEVARGAAARAAGRVLHPSEAAELIAAEVLSALPIDEQAQGACEETGVSWDRESERQREREEPRVRGGESVPAVAPVPAGGSPPAPGSVKHLRSGTESGRRTAGAGSAPLPPWRQRADPTRPIVEPEGTSRSSSARVLVGLPASLEPLLDGLEEADAFELDARLRQAFGMEQRLEARLGPLLASAWARFVHRALGHATREDYARERLGMDPTRARTLVRLERAVVLNQTFAQAYRSGALSWVKASALVPLVSTDPLGWFVGDWVAWAQRVTVRRLREDVEGALALAETDPQEFRKDGGLPAEARADREIGAHLRDSENDRGRVMSHRKSGPWLVGTEEVRVADHTHAVKASHAGDDREIGARPKAPEEICFARFFGPPDVVQLFGAVLCTVRRRMGSVSGRLPTAGAALGVMLDHALSSWGETDGKLAARHKVFARDGWRCAVPGCTSMQNLHDHHIRFRSAGGSNALRNRVTLCAFHHLRGVHAGLLRCVGRAPDGLRWEMGIRPGVTPLLAYRSGDVRLSGASPAPGGSRMSGLPLTAAGARAAGAAATLAH